jgi:hypothetical protein
MTIPILIIALAAGFGAGLFMFGWRGQRTDDHPLCRRCGFDLFGLPSGATRCSECGADLTRPRATRLGHRARRPRTMLAGAFILLVCTSACAPYAWAKAREFDPNPWKPLSWLLSETTPNTPAATRSAAFAEIMRRLTTARLDADEVNRVADVGLAHQADPLQPFLPEWSEIIQQAHRTRLLSSDRWQRYGRQAGAFTLEARPRVRRGDSLPLRVMHSVPRSALSSRNGHLWQSVRVASVRVGDRVIRTIPAGIGSLALQNHGPVEWNETIDEAILANLRDGTHTVRATLLVDVHHAWGGNTPEAVLLSHPVEVEATWDLVGRDVDTVALVPRPSDERPTQVTVGYAGYHPSEELVLNLTVRAGRQALSHTIVVRAGGREARLGSVVCRPYTSSSQLMGAKLPDFGDDRVDLVFVPDPAGARRTVDFTEILGEEIRLPGVRIARPPAAATRPAN